MLCYAMLCYAILYAVLQASCAFQNLDALPSLRIPLSIDRVTLYGQARSNDLQIYTADYLECSIPVSD